TETRPICRSSCVLYTMRLHTSRPKLSVPRMCLALSGGWNASSSFCAIGSYGVSSGAPMAASTTSVSSIRPASRVGLRPIFCSRMVKPSCSTGATRGRLRRVSRTLSLIRHPRIEERIRQIYDQIDDDHQDRADHCDRLYDGIIAARNRREQQLAHAWHCKDRFDDQRAADEETELQPKDGDS